MCREGSHAEAESIASEAVEENRRANPRHPNFAASLHNLALVYVAQGRCSEAEALYEQALTVDDQTGDTGHADKATTLCSLAALRRDKGRFEEAESLLRQALRIRERVHGPEHHWTGVVLAHLATTFDQQGRKDEANRTHEQAMKIFQRAFQVAEADAKDAPEPVPVFRREQVE